MTCKDCICSEVCYYKAFNDQRNLQKRRNDVEKICKSFIHRDSVKLETTTNADRIRAMSDEELAEFLNRVKEPCDCCQLAVVEGACTETLCDDAMTKWLKQPAETTTIKADTCVCCGAIIPEGQMVCPNCLVAVKEG